MKKVISICLALVLLCTLAAPVLADVIWMPYGDTFFEDHMADCEYVSESYEAKQDAPYYRSPEEADKALGTVPAGTVVGIEYLWNHGEWGTGWNRDLPEDGWWVRLEDFRKLYGADDFEAEHRSELISENGVFRPEGGSTVCFWAFPGAASCSSMPISEEFSDSDANINYDMVYTDGEGRKWGRVIYYFGYRDCWVCISDPSNQNLPETAPRYADQDEPDGPSDPGTAAEPDEPSDPGTAEPAVAPAVSPDEPQAKQGVSTTVVILLVCLVGLLAIVASVLLAVLLSRSGKAGKP